MPDLLIDLGWKSALIAGLALLASLAMRSRAAGERVILLRAAIAALLGLPVLAFAVPPLELAVLPSLDPVAATELTMPALAVANALPEPETLWSPTDALLLLYLAGAALVVLRLLAGLATLLRWTRRATPATHPRWVAAVSGSSAALRRPVRLLVSPHVAAPLSWGVSPAWLLIAPDTERRAEQAEAVIAHEMAHVRRLDWPMLLAAQIASALFWFNPLVWLVARDLARQSELAADDDAVRHVAQADYAQTLLTVAGTGAYAAACGMTVTRTMLARRIRRVLEDAPRRPASRMLCAGLLICALAAAAPLAAMKLVRAPAAVPEPVLPAAHVQLQSAPPAVRPTEPRDTLRAVPPQRERVRERSRTGIAAAPKPEPMPATRQLIESSRILMKPAPLMRHRPPRPPRSARPSSPVFKVDVAAESRAAVAKVRESQPRATRGERREKARGLAEGASAMRQQAKDYEAMAAVEGVPLATQRGYRQTAQSLRRGAERLEADAHKLMFEP